MLEVKSKYYQNVCIGSSSDLLGDWYRSCWVSWWCTHEMSFTFCLLWMSELGLYYTVMMIKSHLLLWYHIFQPGPDKFHCRTCRLIPSLCCYQILLVDDRDKYWWTTWSGLFNGVCWRSLKPQSPDQAHYHHLIYSLIWLSKFVYLCCMECFHTICS